MACSSCTGRRITPDSINYQKYAQHVDQLPMAAHMLVALIAPRPILLQTGSTDHWSDPKGEFLAAVAAADWGRLDPDGGGGSAFIERDRGSSSTEA